MIRFLWICFGGAVGTGARYLVSGWAVRLLGSSFAWGTLAVNLVGSFLLAALIHLGTTTELMNPTLRAALTTGAMGGFTTYSTFSYETFHYYQEGAVALGTANIAVTVIACLAGSLLGFLAAQALVGA